MGVLKILFGVGFGCGNTVERFVEDADDSLLLGNVAGCGTAMLLNFFDEMFIAGMPVPCATSSSFSRNEGNSKRKSRINLVREDAAYRLIRLLLQRRRFVDFQSCQYHRNQYSPVGRYIS